MLPGKKLSPADLMQMVRRRALLVVIPPMFTLFAALVYSSRIQSMYQSDMLIAIDPQRVPDAFVRSTVTLRTEQRMDAISVQVLSRTNLQRLIEELDLYPELRKLLPTEDVVIRMRNSIQVPLERSKNPQGENVPNAFHVLFTYPDPNIAAQVTQRIGSLFVEQNAKDRGALAQATNSFLETQLEESRARLVAQEQRLEAFRQTHGKELPTQMQGNLQTLQNMQLQVQSVVESIARDRDRKQLLEQLYREASETPEAPAIPAQITAGGAPSTAGGTPEQQLAAAKALLANLELRYRPDHPDMVRTKRLIETLEAQVSAEPNRPTAPVALSQAEIQRRDRLSQMSAEIESLDRQTTFKTAQEVRLRGEIAEYQRRIEAVPGLESEWVSLTRDYDTQQLAYKELLTKSAAAKVAVDLEQQQIGEHFRIVDPAAVPVHPIASTRLQTNMIGLAIGLFLGLGFAAYLEVSDASFRSDADIMEVLRVPVLANIPNIETRAERTRRRRRFLLASTVGAACLAGAIYVTWTLKLWHSIT